MHLPDEATADSNGKKSDTCPGGNPMVVEEKKMGRSARSDSRLAGTASNVIHIHGVAEKCGEAKPKGNVLASLVDNMSVMAIPKTIEQS